LSTDVSEVRTASIIRDIPEDNFEHKTHLLKRGSAFRFTNRKLQPQQNNKKIGTIKIIGEQNVGSIQLFSAKLRRASLPLVNQ
jgi:hypothetical protein